MLVAETGQGNLYDKTGSGISTEETEEPGWFVGFLKIIGIMHDMFACNIIGARFEHLIMITFQIY